MRVDRAGGGRRALTRWAAAGLALVTAATIVACGAPESGTGGGHDDADVTFAGQMIPHHRQAIAMAKMAATQASSPQVKELASQIDAEQVPEIVQMQTMLSTWGADATEPTLPADAHGMSGMGGTDGADGMGDMGDLPGMMNADQMAQLAATSGPAFDHAFLQAMIRHHEGAVAMAKTEMADGLDPDAITMAQNISDAQEAAIALMQRLQTGG